MLTNPNSLKVSLDFGLYLGTSLVRLSGITALSNFAISIWLDRVTQNCKPYPDQNRSILCQNLLTVRDVLRSNERL